MLHHIQEEACWFRAWYTSTAQHVPIQSPLIRVQLIGAWQAGDSTQLSCRLWGPINASCQRQRHSLNDPSMAPHPKLANSSAAPKYKSLKLPEDFELSPRLPACVSGDLSRTRGEIQDSCCSTHLATAQMEAALLSAWVSQAVGLWGYANRAEP